MLNKKNSLKRLVTGLLAAAAMCSMTAGTVLADEVTEDAEFHAGAAAVMNNATQSEETNEEEDAAIQLSGEEAELAEAEETPVLEETSTVVMANVKDAVNVRAEASEEAEVVGKLYKNCGGEIIERKDGWTYLKSGELTGWTKDEFLLFGEKAEALRQEVGSLKATVKTDALRIRKEASEEAGVYGLAELNEELTAVEELGEWVSVQVDEDTVGYVASQYVDVAFSVDTGKTKEQIAKEEEEKKKAELSKNRGAVAVGTSDVTLLAALIQCEAGNESYEGKLAVGAVVMNRVRSGGYPNSISAVITAKGQFPPATNGKVAAVVARGPSASCIEAAQAAINGASNIGGATHFRAAGSAAGIVIGNHVFW